MPEQDQTNQIIESLQRIEHKIDVLIKKVDKMKKMDPASIDRVKQWAETLKGK